MPTELYPDFEHFAPASEQIGASGLPCDTAAAVEGGPSLLVSTAPGGLAKQVPGRAVCEAAEAWPRPLPGNLPASCSSTPALSAPLSSSPSEVMSADFLAVAQAFKRPSSLASAFAAGSAPLSNTGAQNTQASISPQVPSKPKPKNNRKREEQQEQLLPVAAPDVMDWRFDGFLIDWLRFTVIPEDEQQKVLASWRGEPDDWVEQDTSHMGYRRCYRSDGVSIYYDHAKEGRGICIDICGSGCRKLEESGRVAVGAGWCNLLRQLTTTPGVNITRLDAAIDDRKGLVDLEQVQQCIDAGLVVSRFKDAYEVQKKSLSDGTSKGKTINFGSRASDLMVRMYNKAAEQKLDTGEHWTRVELEAKDENAVALAVALAEAGAHEAGAVVAGVLRNYLTFRVCNGKVNKARDWPVVAWWDEFLQGVAALRLAVAKAVPTVERVRAWIEKQVIPSLTLLFHREQGCYGRSLLDGMIDDGVQRLRPKHHKMLADERRRVALVAPAGGPTGF